MNTNSSTSAQKAEASPSRINEIMGALIAKAPKPTGTLQQARVPSLRRLQKPFFKPGGYNGRGSPD